MASYESFARVYDSFMSDIPYDEWCDYLHSLLLRYGVPDGLVLELGCGTGAMTERLAETGYDMIGVDSSIDMLEMAREKQVESGSDILYLLQDMREFELYGTVRAVVSVCDSLNYITDEQDLLQVFRLVNNYLDPGGIFLFDLNTVYKYEEILAEQVIAENREEGSFIWENWYDRETKINEYDLTLYIAAKNGLYERFEEVHYQKAYTIERVCELLEEAGLRLEAVYDAFTWDEPKPESERVCFAAREIKKRNQDTLYRDSERGTS
ncbi:MAG: class I SAM-dependent methyltransferase [Lachnospiraceae bacterium]|nr:class I SAM-dependent methyltransferase [Lachnospiraceae bacterium]